MGLVIQDGKLLIKDGGLATATRPSEACDCCGDTPVAGKCCGYPYSSSGAQPANTAEEAIELASQSASANSAAIPNSIWTVGTPAGVPWVEGEAWYDSERNQYECTGYWTLGEPGECSQQTEAGCLSGPFTYFTPGETCEGPDDGLYDCPEYPPDPKQTGAWCEAPYQQVDMICAYTKDKALEDASQIEANGTAWCGIEATGSKEPIQDGQGCDGNDNQGLPLCPDAGKDGCTGTNPNQNDPVFGNDCDCGPGWWLEVWDIVPDAEWTCTEYEDEGEVITNPFGTWHPGQTCEEINNCVGETPNRRNPLP